MRRLDDWGDVRWEVVTIAPTAGEAFDVHVLTPSGENQVRQAVVYFPGRGHFLSTTSDCAAALRSFPPLSLQTGRVLVMPVWKGSCERYDGFYEASKRTQVQLRGSHMLAWHEELGRTLDYLETRDDIRQREFGYYGLSYGGSRPLPLLALEDRLKAAVIYSGGFPHGEWPQIADAVNYVPRTTLPVLMLAGRYDAYRPVEASQRPMFDLLGTPTADKRFVVFESGHAPLPFAESLREIADWFDRYLGE